MLRIILKQLFLAFYICLANKQAVAITGEEISAKVSQWLIKEGIKGTPVFSKNTFYEDCDNWLWNIWINMCLYAEQKA